MDLTSLLTHLSTLTTAALESTSLLTVIHVEDQTPIPSLIASVLQIATTLSEIQTTILQNSELVNSKLKSTAELQEDFNTALKECDELFATLNRQIHKAIGKEIETAEDEKDGRYWNAERVSEISVDLTWQVGSIVWKVRRLIRGSKPLTLRPITVKRSVA